MANVNGPVGLVPSRVLGGGCITSNPYSIASAYDTAIHVGDPVEMTGTSNNIGRAAAGTVNAIGVFAGCKFIDAEGRPQFKPYWPANQVATEIETRTQEAGDLAGPDPAARALASVSAFVSKRSTCTGRAPRRRRRSADSADRATPATSCPAARSASTAARPIDPVAPATNTTR